MFFRYGVPTLFNFLITFLKPQRGTAGLHSSMSDLDPTQLKLGVQNDNERQNDNKKKSWTRNIDWYT